MKKFNLKQASFVFVVKGVEYEVKIINYPDVRDFQIWIEGKRITTYPMKSIPNQPNAEKTLEMYLKGKEIVC